MQIIVDEKEIKLIEANSFFKRLKGFMFQKDINYCLKFKTKSIHTFFMKEKIDVTITDKFNNVLYIFKNVPKNKIILKKDAYYFYEFPNNFIDSDIKKIKIKH